MTKDELEQWGEDHQRKMNVCLREFAALMIQAENHGFHVTAPKFRRSSKPIRRGAEPRWRIEGAQLGRLVRKEPMILDVD